MNRQMCLSNPQKQGESIQEYVRRMDSLMAKKQYSVPFERIEMSENVADTKGFNLAERLSPSQKQVYEDSYKAYKTSRGNKIIPSGVNDVLTTDSMLHAGNIRDIDKVLEQGITSGDCRGAIGTGTGCATQTPLCADFWDVMKSYSIKDYFTRSRFNPGEANFLPKIGGTSVSHPNGVVYVINKKHVAPTIMNNSFKVSETNSILYKDGNMGGHVDYITHRAVPIGVPANAIDRIIINSRTYSPDMIAQIKSKIAQKGLHIKLYDLQGNAL